MASTRLHGVNLTGWLTPEPWVSPELFAQVGALDLASLARALGPRRYAELIERHRSTFIGRSDFTAIAARGFNAVRLPFPWYVLGNSESASGELVGCIEHLDDALGWAEEIGLRVIFVLDVTPGEDVDLARVARGERETRVTRSQLLEVIYRVSKRYASRVGFFGLEIADDARPQERQGLVLDDGIPAHVLRNYYREAYEMVRSAAGDDPVVIMPDGGQPGLFGRFMAQRRYRNVWLDCHLDRRSSRADVTGPSGVRRVVAGAAHEVSVAERNGLPVMVGKWSSALPVADASMTPEGRIALERVYTSEQLAAFEGCPGWFFNTWKTSGLLASWDARIALASFERAMIV